MLLVVMASMILSVGVAGPPAWTFDADALGWTPNQHLANVSVQNGSLCADGVGSDPFFALTGLDIATTPWQYVVISLKASNGGEGQLFWSGETTGQYGGLTEEKSTRFAVSGGNTVQDVVLFPFWQTEGVVRQLRLDLYDGAHFEIDAIRIMSWSTGAAPLTNVFSWNFAEDTSMWQVHPAAAELFAPPVQLDVASKGWIAVTLKSDISGAASILWSTGDTRGVHTSDFTIEANPEPHTYLVEMEGIADWHTPVVAFGIRLPEREQVRLDAITISDKPLGPADLAVTYLGAQDALNRTGMPSRVLAVVTNRGGAASETCEAQLVLSPNLRFHDCTPEQRVPALGHGEMKELSWTIVTQLPSAHKLSLKVGDGKMVEGAIQVSQSLLLDKTDYVPKPVPVPTSIDLCAFYFPGWDSDAKWDCLRRVAPIRRPALGYYDESNPECVDWQIKWAVENGISCFLVDWYWSAGSQMLTHWFDAYRKARYRDMLKVAIMWANHNAPDTHSIEDWRNVTKHWIDNYFNLPAYYRIEGKPAIFIWAPAGIRHYLKGSAAVKQCFDESQTMVQQAGYPGIAFVAMCYDFSPDTIQTLLQEGYTGITTYHEWGSEAAQGMARKRMPYASVAKTAPEAWAKKNAAAGALTYYPVVETGWDSRPWHGDKAFVIEGRTPQLFESLLAKAKAYAAENAKNIVILGPVNEWGEGSYIEPCVEFGFDMLEAIRKVFGSVDPKLWPVNAGPRDVGLGPYDFPPRATVSAWTFDGPSCGWKPMMGVGDFTCSKGCLRFRTTSDDPAIVTDSCGAQASAFGRAVVEMQVTGPLPPDAHAQLFWSADSQATSEPASARFSLIADGQMHSYTLDLKNNPRWRGRITLLRFDPCDTKDALIVMDAFRLEP